MFKIALVVFRECLEISMILGIVCAATRSVKNSFIYIISGIMAGIIAASLLAFFITKLSFSFSGLGEEYFNAFIIFLTVIVVGATAIWVKRSARKMPQKMNDLSVKIEKGLAPKIILTSVVASTIFREVTEIVLYVHALTTAYSLTPIDYILGFSSGISMGIIVTIAIYWGLSRIALKYLFKLSFALLVLIAASLASEAAGILTSVGFLEIYNEPLWDSSWIISDFSVIGRILKMLVGYNAQPNSMQLIFYVSTIFIILGCSKIGEKNNAKVTG